MANATPNTNPLLGFLDESSKFFLSSNFMSAKARAEATSVANSIASKRDACSVLAHSICASFTNNIQYIGGISLVDSRVFYKLSARLVLLYGDDRTQYSWVSDKGNNLEVLYANLEKVKQNASLNQNEYSLIKYLRYLRSIYQDPKITRFLEVLEQRSVDFYTHLEKNILPVLELDDPTDITGLRKIESMLSDLDSRLLAFWNTVINRLWKYMELLISADELLFKDYVEAYNGLSPQKYGYGSVKELDEKLLLLKNDLKYAKSMREKYSKRFYPDKAMVRFSDMRRHVQRQGFNPKIVAEESALRKAVEYYDNMLNWGDHEINKLYKIKTGAKIFDRAYEADNQAMISEVSWVMRKVTDDKISDARYPMGRQITAYAAVMPCPHDKNGTWAAKENLLSFSYGLFSFTPTTYKMIDPEEYAKRIYDIITKGYRPSKRPLNGEVVGIGDSYENIYFFIEPHVDYFGFLCSVSWSCQDYCVFYREDRARSKDEYYIITKKRIDPGKQTIYLGNPNSVDKVKCEAWTHRLEPSAYMRIVISELDKMGLKAGTDYVLRDF